jgi:hypothetical protein
VSRAEYNRVATDNFNAFAFGVLHPTISGCSLLAENLETVSCILFSILVIS